MQLLRLLKDVRPIDLDINIFGISLNSKTIKKNDVFVAVNGVQSHGVDFVEEAIKNGASVILSDKIITVEYPTVIIKNLVNHLPTLANTFYPNAKKQKIIAITGTNGKTSVASFLAQTLTSLGINNQVIGTLTDDLTTPDIFTLYQKLHTFTGEWTILEVSSHALVQQRTKGLDFEVVIWTNLSQDHLDYHHTMANYGKAKLLICNQAKFGIFNEDDEFYLQFSHKLPHNSYSLQNLEYQVKSFGFWCNLDNIVFELNLLGEFNLLNMLAGYQTLLHLGFDKLEVLKNITTLNNPVGRMQKIPSANIWVDFAHTPEGLKNVLITLKQHYPKHSITVVFGCGGNRDTNKRAKMGKIASDLASRIILTNDNPRDENEMTIIENIQLGIVNQNLQIITNRALAIEAAISNMTENECVLVAGKGHENYQIIGNEKFVFNDTKTILNILG